MVLFTKHHSIFMSSETLSENKLKTLNSNINTVSNYLNNLANPILDFFDEKFNLLIGTPGRINDHLRKKFLNLSTF